MRNNDFIKAYVDGYRTEGAHGRMAYKDGRLISYRTVICDINRREKTAYFNTKKYSATTSRLQNTLLTMLEADGYTVEKYEGEEAYIWDYQDARYRTVTVDDVVYNAYGG